jgi:hypothetical protein
MVALNGQRVVLRADFATVKVDVSAGKDIGWGRIRRPAQCAGARRIRSARSRSRQPGARATLSIGHHLLDRPGGPGVSTTRGNPDRGAGRPVEDGTPYSLRFLQGVRGWSAVGVEALASTDRFATLWHRPDRRFAAGDGAGIKPFLLNGAAATVEPLHQQGIDRGCCSHELAGDGFASGCRGGERLGVVLHRDGVAVGRFHDGTAGAFGVGVGELHGAVIGQLRHRVGEGRRGSGAFDDPFGAVADQQRVIGGLQAGVELPMLGSTIVPDTMLRPSAS